MHAIVLILTSVPLLNVVLCGGFMESQKYELYQKHYKVVGPEILRIFTGISLVHCASQCSSNSDCGAFQFSVKYANSKGTCELLNNSAGGLIMATPDESCNIYKPFTSTPLLTSTSSKISTQSTTPTYLPDDRNPEFVCDYAISPAKITCNCSKEPYCNGTLQCIGVVSGNIVTYFLDRLEAVENTLTKAQRFCQLRKMRLLSIKNMEQHSTICYMLAAAVGLEARVSFWLDLDKDNEEHEWKDSNGLDLGSFVPPWSQDKKSPGKCCAIAGTRDYKFRWIASDCSPSDSDGWTRYAICS